MYQQRITDDPFQANDQESYTFNQDGQQCQVLLIYILSSLSSISRGFNNQLLQHGYCLEPQYTNPKYSHY